MAHQLGRLEVASLYWVSMDYETLETVLANVSGDYGKSVPKESLYRVLVGLRSKGLVESYTYSPVHEKYVPQAPVGKYPQRDVWWLITEGGDQELERHTGSNRE